MRIILAFVGGTLLAALLLGCEAVSPEPRAVVEAAPSRPQDPLTPYPYLEEEVAFPAAEGSAALAGTLTLPRERSSAPAVILISGGGAQDRDYTLGLLNHRPFLVISDYLTRRGIAVLRYDDRGFGASSGDRSTATTLDFAHDALAGFAYLQSRKEVATDRIGLLGHSEGGTIAALAAAENPSVALIVMLGSPGLPGVEYNLQYEESVGRSQGLTEEELSRKRAFQERIYEVILGEKDPETAAERLKDLYNGFDPNLPEEKLEGAVKRLLSPWFRYNLAHDPGKTLAGIRCPVLALIGEKDRQVPPEGNIVALRRALENGGNADSTVDVFPGVNHFFQTAPTGSPREYGAIEETFSPAALDRIAGWIGERTRNEP